MKIIFPNKIKSETCCPGSKLSRAFSKKMKYSNIAWKYKINKNNVATIAATRERFNLNSLQLCSYENSASGTDMPEKLNIWVPYEKIETV